MRNVINEFVLFNFIVLDGDHDEIRKGSDAGGSKITSVRRHRYDQGKRYEHLDHRKRQKLCYARA